MNKRKIRDLLRLACAILFSWLYIPHLVAYAMVGGVKRQYINSDLEQLEYQVGIKGLPKWLLLLDMLHNNRYYRVIFYHRIGPAFSMLMEWYRPGDRYFTIGKAVKIGKGMWIAHPYATVLAADSIGDNFSCVHCTTLGNTSAGRPTIGNNVQLGANVTVIGPVHIGNNVIVGAGAVVVKDIPDNSVAVGNPARVIKSLPPIE